MNVHEREAGRARDQDVRRVADQRRGAADVRDEHLGDDQRDRVDVERVREQERDRHHQQHRRQVVQERRQQRRRAGEREQHRERAPAGEVAGLDRQPRIDARRLGDLDHQHHPGEQSERVPVDRLDRDLLIDRLRQQHEHRAGQRDLRAVDAVAGDDREGAREDGDRDRHALAGTSRKRVATVRKKSPRVITPSTRPSSVTGTISTRWWRKISATCMSENSLPTSTCSRVHVLLIGSGRTRCASRARPRGCGARSRRT